MDEAGVSDEVSDDLNRTNNSMFEDIADYNIVDDNADIMDCNDDTSNKTFDINELDILGLRIEDEEEDEKNDEEEEESRSSGSKYS